MTDLLRHIIKAGEDGRGGASGALFLGLGVLESAMLSFLDEVDDASDAGGPSDTSFPCLFFFLVILHKPDTGSNGAGSRSDWGSGESSNEGGPTLKCRNAKIRSGARSLKSHLRLRLVREKTQAKHGTPPGHKGWGTHPLIVHSSTTLRVDGKAHP